jgi:hypothetical protein
MMLCGFVNWCSLKDFFLLLNRLNPKLQGSDKAIFVMFDRIKAPETEFKFKFNTDNGILNSSQT